MPAVGLEYRFPFVASLGTSGTQVLEPIAQVIARPNETPHRPPARTRTRRASSSTTPRSSTGTSSRGYDRAEGGVRANVGVQYTITGADGLYANALFGQSYPARRPELVPARATSSMSGRDSGLDIGAIRLCRPARSSRLTATSRSSPAAASTRTISASSVSRPARRRISTRGCRSRPPSPMRATAPSRRSAIDQRREGILGIGAPGTSRRTGIVTGSRLLDLDRYLTGARPVRRRVPRSIRRPRSTSARQI